MATSGCYGSIVILIFPTMMITPNIVVSVVCSIPRRTVDALQNGIGPFQHGTFRRRQQRRRCCSGAVATVAVSSTGVLVIDLAGKDGGASSADAKGAMIILEERSRQS
jgi:hypothetical protein